MDKYIGNHVCKCFLQVFVECFAGLDIMRCGDRRNEVPRRISLRRKQTQMIVSNAEMIDYAGHEGILSPFNSHSLIAGDVEGASE